MMIHPAGGRHLVATVSFLALELRENRKEWDLATVPLAEFQEAGGAICFYPVMCECCWFGHQILCLQEFEGVAVWASPSGGVGYPGGGRPALAGGPNT